MLSILRDLWVDVPGFGHHKINTHFLGEKPPAGGGPQLATDTVEDFLGVPISITPDRFHGFCEIHR